jgi:phosphate transport system protein
MGDQAVNISYAGENYLEFDPIPEVNRDLDLMAEDVRRMVKDSLDAFVRRDNQLSRSILGRDDQVDEAKDQIISALRDEMVNRPDHIDSCLCLMSMAKNLERLADHSTNIAEDVIFLTTGDDIRHGHNQDGTSG